MATPDLTLRTVYRSEDLDRARENLRRHDWAQQLIARLRDEAAATVAGGADHVVAFIPETTPAGIHFTNCPRCQGNAVHGDYRWDPADPDVVECTTCGARYPDPAYPEDAVFRASRTGAGQEISYHSGFGYRMTGFGPEFILHSSWSGHIRAQKVKHMTEQLQSLGILYAVTGDASYGDAAAAILIRFAHVYPNYLVHSGYGEWTDLPPRVAAARLTALPEDEWTVAPNQPDRLLHAGYWMAGRATAVGMEGTFIQTAAIAYDLVRDRLDGAAQALIEADLLREGTYLLCADPALNNKSITNATAAGMVGLVLDDPNLVRFGSRVFWHFIRRWFLPDGGTPESPSYGLMALGGMTGFGDALHGRTLPDGTTADVYGDPAMVRIYRNLYDTLLPDLRYPAFADSWVTRLLSNTFGDLLVQRYGRSEYRALLRGLHGGSADPLTDLVKTDERSDQIYALFHRDPDFDLNDRSERIALLDVNLPWLRVGYLRGGAGGRESAAVLSASHWGVHHHRDSLNLTYVDRGHDALSDLGYLWDRVDRDMTVRTAAHNLVVVDGAEQRTDGRGGAVQLFDRRGPIAVTEASSTPYAQTRLYRRTCVLIDHGGSDRYLVDVFAVAGGAQHDYLWHGPTPDVTIEGVRLKSSDPGPGYGLSGSRRGTADGPWRAVFELGDATWFSAWAPAADEELWVGDGWGERGTSHVSTEPGRVVPYLVRRRQSGRAELSSVFVSAFEVHAGAPIVTGVQAHRLGDDGVLARITTRDGVDVVALRPRSGPTDLTADTAAGPLRTNARVTVLGHGALYISGGTRAQIGDRTVSSAAAQSGGLAHGSATGADESYLIVERADLRALPDAPTTVVVDDGVESLCFSLLDVREVGPHAHLVTFRDGRGSPLPRGEGLRWTITHSAVAEA